jgi:hypothetical protein
MRILVHAVPYLCKIEREETHVMSRGLVQSSSRSIGRFFLTLRAYPFPSLRGTSLHGHALSNRHLPSQVLARRLHHAHATGPPDAVTRGGPRRRAPATAPAPPN